MAKSQMIFGVILVIAVIVIALICFSKKSNTEGFDLYNGYVDDRNKYINEGKQKYNILSSTQDAMSGNFMATKDPSVIRQTNNLIASALVSADLAPSNRDGTLQGIRKNVFRATISPQNKVLEETKKCEALKTRDSCSKLDDPNYKNCGVCIKEGSPFSFNATRKHIGGLLVLPEDRAEAVRSVEGTNLKPTYFPSVGECPGGYFYADREECEKQVNRLDCEEAGKTGGFNDGKTIEGKKIITSKCAQLPTMGDDVFIYEPRNRTFDVNLRVLTPKGTGTCRIAVYNAKKQQVGFGESTTPGVEFLVNIKPTRENEALSILIMMEAPHRYNGKNEVYQVRINDKPVYSNEAAKVCARYGSTQASKSDLLQAQRDGAQTCSPGSAGWTSDNFLGRPSNTMSNLCGTIGLNEGKGATGAVWCFGVKPQQSTNMSYNVTIPPWTESQDNRESKFSKYGFEYKAPSQRAILLQWESSASGKSKRVVGFEPTIIALNGAAPSSTIGGVNSFSALRRFGTLDKSNIIQQPKWNKNFKMSANQHWIWDLSTTNQQIQFDVIVPGIFMDSFYAEDSDLSAVGPLVSTLELSKKISASVCSPDQKPGKYNNACLLNTFVASGGDPNKGEIATKEPGIAQLNSFGELSNIEQYLTKLFIVATTGKDMEGNPVGSNPADRRNTINDAALKMFGFEIATPCEDVAQDQFGNIVIVSKRNENLDPQCLDYLWMNVGSEFEKGQEDSDKRIKNTYTSIGNRYSGLRKAEAPKRVVERSPFTMCQRSGKVAPISEKGVENAMNIQRAQALGTVDAVQKWYNSVFNNANNVTKNEEAQDVAVEACYGVQKAEPEPKPPKDLGCWNSSDWLLSYDGNSTGKTEQERQTACIDVVKEANITARRNFEDRVWEGEPAGGWKGRDIIGIRWGQCQSGESYGPGKDRYKALGKNPDPKGYPTTKWGNTCDLNGHTARITQVFNPSRTKNWWEENKPRAFLRSVNSTIAGNDLQVFNKGQRGDFCRGLCADDPQCMGYIITQSGCSTKSRLGPITPLNGTDTFTKNPEYKVKTEYVGCYKDAQDRAVPNLRAQGGPTTVDTCRDFAYRNNDNVFALQAGNYYGGKAGICFTGQDPKYDKYGKQTNEQMCGPAGGDWTNSVYRIR